MVRIVSKPLKGCALLALLGAFIWVIGQGMNWSVIIANDGKMPVAVTEKDILFVIGSPKVIFIPSPGLYVEDREHQAMADHMPLRILADRIPIAPLTTSDQVPLIEWPLAKVLTQQPPIDYVFIASFGDLLIWTGMALAYHAALGTLMIITLKIFRKALSK